MGVLGNYIKIKHGYAFKGTGISSEDNGIVLVTPGNFAVGGGFKEDKCKFFIEEYPAEYCLNEDDLIVTMTDLSKNMDTLGYSALVPKSDRVYLHNQRIGLVELIRDDVDKHYIYWFMRTYKYQRTIAGSSSGTTVHHTSPSRIYEVEIDPPAYEIQRKVAFVLDSIERKIKLNEEVNNNLQEQALSLYKALYLLNDTSEWQTVTLSDIANITMGQSPSGSSYNEDGYGTIFFQGSTDFGFRYPSVRVYTTEPTRMAKNNDILMSVRAPVGTINIAHEDCCIGRGLSALSSNDGHPSFLFYTMLSLKDQLDSYNGEGTVFGSINQKALKAMPVVLPPASMVDKFERSVTLMDALIRSNHDEICRLQSLRDSLLPKLMSGELDVSVIGL